MIKRIFKRNRPALVCILIIIIMIASYLGFKLYSHNMTIINDQKVSEYIVNELQYGISNAESELTTLLEYSELKYLSPAVRGNVFERISLFYSPDDSPVLYYDTIGKALFYLELGEDYNTSSNIYADLSNYYYTHSELNLAQATLDQLDAKKNFEELESEQIKSYIHRLHGILDTANGNYPAAYDHFMESIEHVNNDPEALYGPSYIAITEIDLAYLYYQTGEFDKCREIVDKYADSEFFTQTIYEDVLARDFKIPYYKVALNIRVHDGDIPMVEPLILSFMETCEKYGYRNIELEQLTYMQENLPAESPEFDQRMVDTIADCYKQINEDLYHRQAILMDSQIDFSKQNVLEKEKAIAASRRQVVNVIIVTIIIMLLLWGVITIISQGYTDALTKVNNRRSLNHAINYYDRRSLCYTAIMIDIDDFKSINDTFGHKRGDEVLRALGQILLAERHNGFRAYRYGGEEFAVILPECDLGKTIRAAERIREGMEALEFKEFGKHITISLGVGSRTDGKEDVIKQADDNLYYSKQNGKNIVTYTQSGNPVLYRKKV